MGPICFPLAQLKNRGVEAQAKAIKGNNYFNCFIYVSIESNKG